LAVQRDRRKPVNGTAQTAREIIASHTDGESIYHRIGKALTSVIPSDVSAIEVFDRNGDYAERPWSDAGPQISRHFQCFLANRFDHPLFKEFVISGLRNPVRISDCPDARDFLGTGMFNEFFKPLGISTQIAIALPSDSMGVPVLVLARSKHDFTLKEKNVMRELIPRIRRQIAVEQSWGHYELLMNQLLAARTAVALIAFHSYVVHSTPQVSDLLGRYFPDHLRNRHKLPRQLVQLPHARSSNVCSTHTFSSEDSQSSLIVTVCGSENGDQQLLLFKETVSPHKILTRRLDLSPRLVDVLLLIEEGYSNKQIAERLRLSPNTIRTLVETLLRKINALNRTQAASLARKCLDEV
jgi:DNA-binding CsgD family transcriptional regulator